MAANDFAIRIEGLSKQYQLGQRRQAYDTLRDHIVRSLRSVGPGRGKRERGTIWALNDVSFEVEQGEVVGIIGRNGAGKTTLLKILSRITEPTKGYADVRGRLSSLLEVGTGFHPELTGRENVYLNGAILGMRRSEVTRKFAEIVEFAGIEKFLDTPVKRYSSGMFVRLAFSVAAHLEPEVLMVDEVLAVGDAEFQKRCLGRMEAIGKSGRTIVFVSHNMATVTRLCQRVILLDGGSIVADGPGDVVTAQYLHSDTGTSASREWPDPTSAPGDELVRLRAVRVVDEGGHVVPTVDIREEFGIEVTFDVLGHGPPIRPQILIADESGLQTFNAMDTDPRWREDAEPGTYVSTAWLPANLLNEGLAFASVFVSTLASQKTIQHVFEGDVVAIQVTDPLEGDSAKGDFAGHWPGVVSPLLTWTTKSG
jgi:homopolymeric O-antigen transport system ATP-binding protein